MNHPTKLAPERRQQLSPLVLNLARLIASGSTLTASELTALLGLAGMGDEADAQAQLRTWADLLLELYRQPSPEARSRTLDVLKADDVPVPVAILAIALTAGVGGIDAMPPRPADALADPTSIDSTTPNVESGTSSKGQTDFTADPTAPAPSPPPALSNPLPPTNTPGPSSAVDEGAQVTPLVALTSSAPPGRIRTRVLVVGAAILVLAILGVSGSIFGRPLPAPTPTPAPLPIALSVLVPTATRVPPTPVPTSTAAPTSTPQPTSTPSPVIPPRLIVGNTGGDGVYLRRTPRQADKIIAWPDGTVLSPTGQTVTGDGWDWYQVRDPKGNIGYVPAQYVSAGQ
jgi:hypothetical protein